MGNNIKIWYDEETDIFYVSLKEGVSVDSEEVSKNVRVEYDKQGQVIGLEIHNITEMLVKPIIKHIKESVKV